MERKNAWKGYDEAKSAKVDALAKDYMDFLDNGKTERECVDTIVNQIEAAGYRELPELMKEGKKLSAGDKVYAVWMNKTVVMFQIGTKPMTEGLNILGAHIDSPRLDIKQNPLYEDSDFALLDTHYYGGIKKYQWVTLPLALHGVVAKKDGSIVEINIGENEDDPVFFISDLLIHLSAELEVVPAGKAREAGLDRSMVLGYGQDDRVCAFTSLAAMLEIGQTERTACCILVDKEEIGSVGATGMQSRFFENTVAEELNLVGEYSELNVRRCLAASDMLSSDVSAAFDPSYASAFEKKNAAFFGRGMVFNKFTGARGKSGSNDANAEYVAHIRAIMEESGVAFQTAELGKIDVGGGGTIAYILALYGMNVIDCGVAVLSMHAPWEATSKADIYETKCGYVAFLEKACL